MTAVSIAGRRVGSGGRCFLIAEAGVNHNGSPVLAGRLVDAAARAGADAVKFQTFRADLLAGKSAVTARYQRRGAGGETFQREMLRRLELSAEEHRVLEARCRKRGILFLSTAFDEAGADFLDSLGVPAFKIASGDLTNHPFLSHVARKGKPVILSTGMATLAEVGEAVRVLRRTGNRKLVLLHCVSAYPTNPADVNLRAMDTLRRRFRVPTGYSDHTEALSVPLAAAALGAAVIEKHFTLDRSLPGPDQRMSIEPEELAAFVRGVREVEASLGDGVKRPAAVERETAAVARRSLAAARDLSSGERLDRSALAVLRPGTGLPPRLLPALLGRRLNRNVMAGTLLRRGWLR